MVAEFPEANEAFDAPSAVEDMKWVKSAISTIRNVRGELSIAPSKTITAIVIPNSPAGVAPLERNRYLIETLARVSHLEVTRDRTPPKRAVTAVGEILEVFIPIEETRFVEERRRLEKEVQKVEKDLLFVKGKLANDAFLSKAPKEVVKKERRKQAELEKIKERLEEGLKRLEYT